MANLIDQPMFLFQDNYLNTLYTELGEAGHYEQVYYNPDFGLVASYQDHLGMVGGIIAELSRNYHIDTSRIYVGGVSAEGNASWSHGIQISDRWAAILPVSAGTAGYDEQLWRNLENLGILAVHGTEDDLCAVEDVDATVEMLEGWGFDVEYWRYEGEGHGTMFYRDWQLMVDWLLDRERALQPARVHKAIKSPRNTEAYWLRATGLRTLELYWMHGPPGPASGSAGAAITVLANGDDLGARAHGGSHGGSGGLLPHRRPPAGLGRAGGGVRGVKPIPYTQAHARTAPRAFHGACPLAARDVRAGIPLNRA